MGALSKCNGKRADPLRWGDTAPARSRLRWLRRRRRLTLAANGGAEHMVPNGGGDAEVASFRRVMMAHVPGAEVIEIRGGCSVRVVMDHVMHDPIPPISGH